MYCWWSGHTGKKQLLEINDPEVCLYPMWLDIWLMQHHRTNKQGVYVMIGIKISEVRAVISICNDVTITLLSRALGHWSLTEATLLAVLFWPIIEVFDCQYLGQFRSRLPVHKLFLEQELYCLIDLCYTSWSRSFEPIKNSNHFSFNAHRYLYSHNDKFAVKSAWSLFTPSTVLANIKT